MLFYLFVIESLVSNTFFFLSSATLHIWWNAVYVINRVERLVKIMMEDNLVKRGIDSDKKTISAWCVTADTTH